MAYNGTRPPLPDNWSEELCTLIDGCWQPDPSNRFTFDEIVEILKTKRSLIQIFRTSPEETPIKDDEIVILPIKRRKDALRLRSNSFATSGDSDYVTVRTNARRPFTWLTTTQTIDESVETPSKDKKHLWKGTL